MTDLERVTELLGRAPQGDFEVVVRDDHGDPVVIRNAPLLHDGTPMPTRFWLVGRDANREVGRLEADGGVRRAEAEIPAEEIAAAHARHAAARDAEVPADHDGPRPFGGVAGTREGVKCLHAHYAAFLAGEDDPVGRWVADRLGAPSTSSGPTGPADVLVLLLDHDTTTATIGGQSLPLPVGSRTLAAGIDSLRPRPEELTNAIGVVVDHLDDIDRELPAMIGLAGVALSGPGAAVVAAVEVGQPVELPFTLTRAAAEDVFRTLATEAHDARRLNPGLPAEWVHEVLGVCAAIVAVMRTYSLEAIDLVGAGS